MVGHSKSWAPQFPFKVLFLRPSPILRVKECENLKMPIMFCRLVIGISFPVIRFSIPLLISNISVFFRGFFVNSRDIFEKKSSYGHVINMKLPDFFEWITLLPFPNMGSQSVSGLVRSSKNS